MVEYWHWASIAANQETYWKGILSHDLELEKWARTWCGSNLEHPPSLKCDPFGAGNKNKVSYRAEFLMPEHAKVAATYDHPFFGKWPAITENIYGTGTLLYEGTYLSDALQAAVLKGALTKLGLMVPDEDVPAAVPVQHGVNKMGKRVHYYFNYSASEVTAKYR